MIRIPKAFLALATVCLSTFSAQAGENVIKKVGNWNIILVLDEGAKFNRCLAHLPGPQGFLRIHSSAPKKWAVSIPGTSPSFKLAPKKPYWSEMNIIKGSTIGGGNETFTTDATAGRASATPGDMTELRNATALDIKIFNSPDPCEGNKGCASRTYHWDLKDIKPALAAVEGCVVEHRR